VGQHWLDVVIATLHVPLLVVLTGALLCWVRVKLPPFVIFKGAKTSCSKIMKEFDSVESWSKFGYPEGMFYTVQSKAWMDKARMHDWIDTVWSPYTKGTRRGGRDTYLLMDEF
jgi:hypothetical protein